MVNEHRERRMVRDERAESSSALVAHEAWPKIIDARPRFVMALCCLYLGLAWGLVFAVDIYGPRGGPDTAHLWPPLFNRGPVEFAQWFALAWAIVVFAFSAGRMDRGRSPRLYSFLVVMSVALSLMLIEEAGDIRHTLRTSLSPVLPGEVSPLIEPTYFVALAALPVYAVVRYGPGLLTWRTIRPYLVVGVISYGLAAGMSATESWFRLLRRTGYFFHEVLPGSTLHVPGHADRDLWYFLFGDGPVEETLELLGAVAFLALGLAVAQSLRADACSASTTLEPHDPVASP